MVTREELFNETEERIEKTTSLLRSYFYNLGLFVYKNQNLLPSVMGVSLIEAAKKAEKELKEAEERKNDDTLFSLEYDEKKKEKIEVDDALELLREKEKDTRLMLGALIYEQCSLGLLPRESFSSVYDDAESEKVLSKKSNSSSFWSRLTSSSSLMRFKRNDSMRYLDYSSLADNEEIAITINGEKAQSLIATLRSIKKEREQKAEKEVELESFLTENLARRKSLEKNGTEEDEVTLTQKKNEFNETIINYGNYLYDRGASWIGEDTPSEVLDTLQLIIESQNEYSSLLSRRSRLEKEAKADDYKAMIEEEREKIRILEDEKNRIDIQIREIEREIDRLENQVNRLLDK